jgi:hypothetical protein
MGVGKVWLAASVAGGWATDTGADRPVSGSSRPRRLLSTQLLAINSTLTGLTGSYVHGLKCNAASPLWRRCCPQGSCAKFQTVADWLK